MGRIMTGMMKFPCNWCMMPTPVPISYASKLQLVEKLVRRNFLTRDLRSPVLLSKLLVSPLITSTMLPYTILQSTPPSRSLDSSSGCIGVYKAIAGIYYHQPPVECLHLKLSSNEYEAPPSPLSKDGILYRAMVGLHVGFRPLSSGVCRDMLFMRLKNNPYQKRPRPDS